MKHLSSYLEENVQRQEVFSLKLFFIHRLKTKRVDEDASLRVNDLKPFIDGD